MQHKSKTQPLLKSFIDFIYTQFLAHVKASRVNNGSRIPILEKFFSIPWDRISMYLLYTPQQNGVVE